MIDISYEQSRRKWLNSHVSYYQRSLPAVTVGHLRGQQSRSKFPARFSSTSRRRAARPPTKPILHTRAAHEIGTLGCVSEVPHERISGLSAYHFPDSAFVRYWMDLAQHGRKT
jgi:hypothetical protein